MFKQAWEDGIGMIYDFDIDYIRFYKPNNLDYSLPFKSNEAWVHENVLEQSNIINIGNSVEITNNSMATVDNEIFFIGKNDSRVYYGVKNNNSWNISLIPYNYTPAFPGMLAYGDLIYNEYFGKVVYIGQDSRVQMFGKTNTQLGWYHDYIDNNWNNTTNLASTSNGILDAAKNNGDIFYKGYDNRLRRLYYQNNQFIPELVHFQYGQSSSNHVLGDVKTNKDGNAVFYKGLDKRLQCYYKANGIWNHAWIDNNWATNVNLVNDDDGSIIVVDDNIVFYKGTDSKLHKYYWSVLSSSWEHELMPLNYYSSNNLIMDGFSWDEVNRRLYYIGFDGKVQFVEFNSNYQFLSNYWIDDYWNNNNFICNSGNYLTHHPSIQYNPNLGILYQMNGNTNNIGLFSWKNCENSINTFGSNLLEDTKQNIFRTIPIKENKNSKDITRIFPNPATNQLNIVVDTTHKKFDYYILDKTGRILLQNFLGSKTCEKVDISKLTPGIYFLKIVIDDLQIFHYQISKEL